LPYKRITKDDEELRQRHIAGGKTRKGPRIQPGPDDEVSQTGHVMPKSNGYRGARNFERNERIVKACETKSLEAVAVEFGLSVNTIDFIRRYHPKPEAVKK
jgi:hypothetical protein